MDEHAPDPVDDAKAALRRRLRAARRARAVPDRARAAEEIAAVLAARPEVRAAGSIAGYAAMPTEPSVDPALDRVRHHARVLLPIVEPGHRMSWAADDGPRRAPAAGIGGAEPTGEPAGDDALARVDVVLVPALAVSRDGLRLGQGGGYYDRALAGVTGPLRVAVLFDDELLPAGAVPAEPFDLRVDAVVTPSGWYPVSATAA